jgi:hypothetical protein
MSEQIVLSTFGERHHSFLDCILNNQRTPPAMVLKCGFGLAGFCDSDHASFCAFAGRTRNAGEGRFSLGGLGGFLP